MADQEGLKQKFLQAIDQDDSLNADQKKEKKHKIEKEIAAGAITAGLGYEVIQIWPPNKLVLYIYPFETDESSQLFFVFRCGYMYVNEFTNRR